jgi:hypothetical protein
MKCYCGHKNCTPYLHPEAAIYDDRRLDRRNRESLMGDYAHLLLLVNEDTQAIGKDHLILLPSLVYGFVLRSLKSCEAPISLTHHVVMLIWRSRCIKHRPHTTSTKGQCQLR